MDAWIRLKEMLVLLVVHGLVLTCQVRLGGGTPQEVRIGVLLDPSQMDEQLVDAATDFIQHDVDVFKDVTVNVTTVRTTDSDGDLLDLALTLCDMLQEGTHGVVGHVDCPSAHVVADLLSSHGVPALLVAPPDCDLRLPKGIFRMRTKSSHFNRALQAILSSEGVTTQVTFYDRFTELVFLSRLLEQHVGIKMTSVLLGSHLERPQRELLTDLARSGEKAVFMVFLRPQAVARLLKMAVTLRLNTPFQTWIVLYEDPFCCEVFSTRDWEDGNLLVVSTHYTPLSQLPCPQELFHLQAHIPLNITLDDAFMLDAIVLLVNSILKTEANSSLPSPPATSCTSGGEGGWAQGAQITEQIKQSHFRGASGETHFGPDGYNEGGSINLWAVDAHSSRGHSLRAHWTPRYELVEHHEPLITNSPNNFRNKTLRVGVVQSAPYVFVEYDDNNIGKYSGFCIEIVEVLAKVLNFRVEYVDGGEDYGTRDDSGDRWTGMIGKVMRKEVDFAAAAFSVTEERESAVDFTIPFYQDSSSFLLKRPHEGPKIARVFLPYHPTVWTAIFATVAVVGSLLFAVRFCFADTGTQIMDPATVPPAPGLLKPYLDNLWFAYGTYVEQSMEHYPVCQSGRVLVVFWWLFTIIMSATYTANLVASLTVTISEKPISTLNELADDPNVLPLVVPGNSLNDLFRQAAPDSVYGRLWTQLQQVKAAGPLPNTTREALTMVATGQYALINDRGIIGYSASERCDEFVVSAEKFRPMGLALALHKGSEIKSIFDINIAKMQESGLIQKWHARWWVPTPSGCGAASGLTSSWQCMGLESLAGAFLVLAGAVGVALMALALERLLVNSRRGKAWAPADRRAENSDTA